MIIGHGLLARAFAPSFADDPAVTVFAAGVSNSGETRPEAFTRETQALEQALDECRGCLVYFSTCSVNDAEQQRSPYVRHKMRMEEVAARASRYLVFRLPQVVGDTPNPHTLTNYLHANISAGIRFPVWANAWRNIIDIVDVARIGSSMIRDGRYANRWVNIANPESIRVTDLVAIFERVLGVAARYDTLDRGDHYPIDVADTIEVARRIGVRFGPHYVEKVIEAYYGKNREPS